MFSEPISTAGLSAKLKEIVGLVQSTLRRETGETYDPRLVEESMSSCVAGYLERLEEDLAEMFTTPGRREYQELLSMLEHKASQSRALAQVDEIVHLAAEYGDESIFAGRAAFSPSKLAAMIEYLTSKGHNVYKTSLNKLLFYSDLTAFYLRGQGISGAVYLNRPYGPVADPAGPILSELVRDDRVRIVERTQTLESAAEPDQPSLLTAEERKVLDWVAETYGEMSASEISGYSHSEMAYKYTEPNEPIAYAYGKFFQKLPPKDLLANH